MKQRRKVARSVVAFAIVTTAATLSYLVRHNRHEEHCLVKGSAEVKSPYSNSQGNCVDVEHVILPDNEFVKVIDTKGKTGENVQLLFDRNEWDAFISSVRDGLFDWEALKAHRAAMETSPQRIAGKPVSPDPQRRTPENLAYINGKHAERAGWVPLTFERFCRRFTHDENDPKARKLYDAFQSGRRAEAHEKSIAEGH